MSDKRFIIEIRSKGFQKAQSNLLEVKKGADSLATSTKSAATQTRGLSRDLNKGKGVVASFRRETSALRNNMLLFTFAIGGAITAVSGFVGAFASAQDSANRFKVMFGDLGEEAENFASVFATNFGFAKTTIMETMEVFQGLFVPLGFSTEAAFGLSKAMTQLANDVGSFQDKNPAEVARMFTSALIGNHEAVKRLNIQLSEASVKQAAVNNGFALGSAKMTEMQKVMGRVLDILDKTTAAVGDGTRTFDDYNNRVKRLSEQYKILSEEIGESLLPIAEFGIEIGKVVGHFSVVVSGIGAVVAVFVGLKLALIAMSAEVIAGTAALAALTGSIGFVALAAGALFASIAALIVNLTAETEATKELNKIKKEQASLVKLLREEVVLSVEVEEEINEVMVKQLQERKKRITSLAIEAASIGVTSTLIKEAIRVRLAEGRTLTANEVLLLKYIDAKKAEQEASDASEKASKQYTESLKVEEQALQAKFMRLMGQNELDARILETSVTMSEEDKKRIANIIELTRVIQGKIDADAEALSLQNKFNTVLESSKSNTIERIQNLMFEIENNKELVATESQRVTVLDMLKTELIDLQQGDYLKNMALESDQMANGILAASRAMKTLTSDAKITDGQIAQMVGSIMMMIPGLQVPGALLQGMGMLTAHTGGLIQNNGIQRFAQGGQVQGEDNVPILAQAGEFIMKRDAVQNIGVQNLANMNRTGNSGGVTINISGNMIGNDEFVRDNLIPEIQKVSNQGLA
tara:strand:- start:1050 stop:3305 length:2256 start_codon:yes stop_codon:yes gene_type:complete